ncbi:MAG: hypothetical protein WAW31_00110 [Smithella sp.]
MPKYHILAKYILTSRPCYSTGNALYIRKVTHTDQRNRQDYHTFKLVESVRTGRGPRQRAILNWGSEFSLPEEQWKLRDLGFNKPATDAAIGVIAARLIAPGSERSTHVWLQDVTALDDLLGAGFVIFPRIGFTRRRTCFCGAGQRLKRIGGGESRACSNCGRRSFSMI